MKRNELIEACRERGIQAEESATDSELFQRIQLFDAGMAQADLEPAGYKRDEQLARRKDDLEQRIEEKESEGVVHRMDPDAFKEDREILYKSIDQKMIEVTDAQPNYVYCWTYYGGNSAMVWAKKALGWEVVSGDMPECRGNLEADGTRRIGDTLLMRIPREGYEQLRARQELAAARQHDAVGSRLKELGERARGYGLKVHEDLSTVQVGPNTLMDVVEKRSAAEKVAMKHIDKKLREGTVPGVPAPGD